MVGKKIDREYHYQATKREIIERYSVRSTKVVVSKLGDIANAWSIEDAFVDDDLVETILYFSGWVKIEGEWYLQSVMGHEVETGWTW